MEIQGYPQLVILLVLAVGVPLAFVRPFAAFLLSILLMTAGHVTMFNQTRMAALGPYFNLTDACMLVAVVAFMFDKFRRKEPVWLPPIVGLMVFVIIIAAAQSFWKLGWTYETMRACRWAIQLPLAFLLGANLVTSEDRAKRLVATLLIGALLAAAQHALFAANLWRTKSVSMETYHLIRTIGYWAGCMPSAFLIAAALWTKPRDIVKRTLYVAAGLLFLASVFLSQTRSLWVATAVGLLCLITLFRSRHRLRYIAALTVGFLVLFVAFGWVGQFLFPGLDIFEIIIDRARELSDTGVHVGTRARSLAVETANWAEGTLVFGRGLAFFQTIRNYEVWSRRIAFGHLGYVTYLSQLGLIGLLVYGVLLPLGVLRNGLWLGEYAHSSSVRYTGLLAAASMMCLSVMFIMSAQFLSPGYEAPGVLYGAIWILARTQAVGPPESYEAGKDRPSGC